MGFGAPRDSECPASEEILTAAGPSLRGRVRRALVYAPDAIGRVQTRRFPGLRDSILANAPYSFPMRAAFPPKTPVCFAGMFTGAGPGVHGIRRYEKPVLACDTLFYAVIRGGGRAAIVAVEDSSIDMIFRGRDVDYRPEPDDGSVLDSALELIRRDGHDLVVVYQQDYDDLLHRADPFGPEALPALEGHVRAFGLLSEAVREHWAGHPRVSVFAPDHGAHLDAGSGRGDHGLDIPDDMEVEHFWDLDPAAALRAAT
ncbi:MAG: alkaline phosphatase family protein [Candidatus Fermentibacter sp.]|nr:alkaline phosphatase family protein [Candidatus Fermentibacter sp.]